VETSSSSVESSERSDGAGEDARSKKSSCGAAPQNERATGGADSENNG
jgi:hypothetical protein